MSPDPDFGSWFDCSEETPAAAETSGDVGWVDRTVDQRDDRRWWRERVRDARRHAFLAEERRRGAEDREQTARRRVGELEQELAALPRIEQAKGMLMAVFGLDPAASLRVLGWVSQRAGIDVAVVADRFVDLTRSAVGSHVGDQIVAALVQLARRPDSSASLCSVPGPRDSSSGSYRAVARDRLEALTR